MQDVVEWQLWSVAVFVMLAIAAVADSWVLGVAAVCAYAGIHVQFQQWLVRLLLFHLCIMMVLWQGRPLTITCVLTATAWLAPDVARQVPLYFAAIAGLLPATLTVLPGHRFALYAASMAVARIYLNDLQDLAYSARNSPMIARLQALERIRQFLALSGLPPSAVTGYALLHCPVPVQREQLRDSCEQAAGRAALAVGGAWSLFQLESGEQTARLARCLAQENTVRHGGAVVCRMCTWRAGPTPLTWYGKYTPLLPELALARALLLRQAEDDGPPVCSLPDMKLTWTRADAETALHAPWIKGRSSPADDTDLAPETMPVFIRREGLGTYREYDAETQRYLLRQLVLSPKTACSLAGAPLLFDLWPTLLGLYPIALLLALLQSSPLCITVAAGSILPALLARVALHRGCFALPADRPLRPWSEWSLHLCNGLGCLVALGVLWQWRRLLFRHTEEEGLFLFLLVLLPFPVPWLYSPATFVVTMLLGLAYHWPWYQYLALSLLQGLQVYQLVENEYRRLYLQRLQEATGNDQELVKHLPKLFREYALRLCEQKRYGDLRDQQIAYSSALAIGIVLADCEANRATARQVQADKPAEWHFLTWQLGVVWLRRTGSFVGDSEARHYLRELAPLLRSLPPAAWAGETAPTLYLAMGNLRVLLTVRERMRVELVLPVVHEVDQAMVASLMSPPLLE